MERPNDPGLTTPLGPLPDPGAPRPAPVPSRRPSARATRAAGAPPGGPPRLGAALRAGLRHAGGSWRPLLLVLCVQLGLALTVVAPLAGALAEPLDHHAHASALAGAPDDADRELGWEAGMHPGVWRDLGRQQEGVFSALSLAFFWVCVAGWVFGAFAAGGFLGTVGSGRVRLGAFVEAGARRFGPLLRVGIAFALAYYLLGRLVLEAWAGSVASDEHMAASQGTAFWGERVREGVMVLGFLWLRLVADSARAHLVVTGRRGALRALAAGVARALSPRRWALAALVGGVAFGAIVGLGPLSRLFAGTGTVGLLGTFALIQGAVLLRWASRAALLGGLAALEPPSAPRP